MKKLLIFALVIASFWGLNRLYFFLTDDFTMDNITSDTPLDNPKWSIAPLSKTEDEQIAGILKQPFHYLCKGGQMYILVSEDEKYIIKFFKYKFLNALKWPQLLPQVSYVKERVEQDREHRLEKKNNLFIGFKIAFEELKEETLLLFVHLNAGPSPAAILRVTDKLGFKHEIDLEKTSFVLQKRAELLEEMLRRCDSDTAREWLCKIASLLRQRRAKGIVDSDPFFWQNLAQFNGEVVFIDPGQFKKEQTPFLLDPRQTKELEEWALQFHPQLQSEIKMIFSNSPI